MSSAFLGNSDLTRPDLTIKSYLRLILSADIFSFEGHQLLQTHGVATGKVFGGSFTNILGLWEKTSPRFLSTEGESLAPVLGRNRGTEGTRTRTALLIRAPPQRPEPQHPRAAQPWESNRTYSSNPPFKLPTCVLLLRVFQTHELSVIRYFQPHTMILIPHFEVSCTGRSTVL